MNIQVNGETVTLEGPLTVAALLENRQVESPEMVAVQVNGEFIDKASYAEVVINNNDEVEFLYFMGGGER